MLSRAGASRVWISSARAVGSITPPARMNNGSLNSERSLPKALLMVVWQRNSRSAARVTLRSCITVSKTTSRLRSARRRSFLFIMFAAMVSGFRTTARCASGFAAGQRCSYSVCGPTAGRHLYLGAAKASLDWARLYEGMA
ncbi:hypothetical protein D9M73_185010 [compost metagenome]